MRWEWFRNRCGTDPLPVAFHGWSLGPQKKKRERDLVCPTKWSSHDCYAANALKPIDCGEKCIKYVKNPDQ